MRLKKIVAFSCLLGLSLGSPLSAPCNTEKAVSAVTPPKEAEPTTPPIIDNPHEAPVPAPLPSSEEMTNSYESAFIRMIVTLLGLVLLVFATFWILRRLGGGKFKMGSSHHINVIEKRALSPKSMLYVVEIGSKRILISESQLEVRTLTSLEQQPDAAD